MVAYAQGTPKQYLVAVADASATLNSTFTLTVTAKDGSGNTQTSVSGTVALAGLSAAGYTFNLTGLTLTNGVGTTALAQFSGTSSDPEGGTSDVCAIRASATGYMDGVAETTVVSAGAVIDANALLLCRFNGANGATSTVDSSLSPAVMLLNTGTTLSTSTKVYGSASVSCTTDGAFAVSATKNFSSIGTGNVTFEYWMKNPGVINGCCRFYCMNGAGRYLEIYHQRVGFGDGSFLLQLYTHGAAPDFLEMGNTISDGDWHHYALTRASGSNIWNVWEDGGWTSSYEFGGPAYDFTGVSSIVVDDNSGSADFLLDTWRVSNTLRYTAGVGFTPAAQ